MFLNHRLLTLICAMLFLTACGNGQNNTPEKRSDPHLYTTNKEDRPMNQAMATARCMGATRSGSSTTGCRIRKGRTRKQDFPIRSKTRTSQTCPIMDTGCIETGQMKWKSAI